MRDKNDAFLSNKNQSLLNSVVITMVEQTDREKQIECQYKQRDLAFTLENTYNIPEETSTYLSSNHVCSFLSKGLGILYAKKPDKDVLSEYKNILSTLYAENSVFQKEK